MKIQEFMEERVKTFLEMWATDIEEVKTQLKRAEVFSNGNVTWAEQDDDMTSYKTLSDLQLSFDMNWNDWVTMSPDFDSFSEEEQDEIKEHDLFQQTPINVWNLI